MSILLNKKLYKIVIYTLLLLFIIYVHLPEQKKDYCLGNSYEDIIICLNENVYLDPTKAIEILINKYELLKEMDLLYEISQAKKNKTILMSNRHKKYTANADIFSNIGTIWFDLSKEQRQKLIKLYEPYLHDASILNLYLELNYDLKDEDKIKLLIEYKNKYTFRDMEMQCYYNILYYKYEDYYNKGLIKEPYELDCKIKNFYTPVKE